jgi:hypothetical protein
VLVWLWRPGNLLFYGCTKNREAGEALLRCVRSYDQNLTEEKSLRMELTADETFLLPTVAKPYLLLDWNLCGKIRKSGRPPHSRVAQTTLNVINALATMFMGMFWYHGMGKYKEKVCMM